MKRHGVGCAWPLMCSPSPLQAGRPQHVLLPVHFVITVSSRSQLEPRFAGSLDLSESCLSWVQRKDSFPCQNQNAPLRKDTKSIGMYNIPAI